MARTKDKMLAIKMRRSGKTHSQIREKIDALPKSTLSHWLTGVKFTEKEIARIEKNALAGRQKSRIAAAETKKKAKLRRIKIIESSARKEFYEFINDPLFVAGLCLYWGEGAKKSSGAEIINSDYSLLNIAIQWSEKFLAVKRDSLVTRLYIHDCYAQENIEEYWVEKLMLRKDQIRQTIFKKTAFDFKKNIEYKGCLRVHLGGIDMLRRIMQWQTLLANYFKVK